MTSSQRPRYVVDASAAIKWYLKDEPYVFQADALLTAYGEGRIDLMAPQHIHYEVTNALRTAVHRGRFSEELARQSMYKFFELGLPVIRGSNHIYRGWDASRMYGCALYDGLYVALSEMTGAPLVHADRRLRNTLSGSFQLEMWIEDFTMPNGPAP